MGTSRSTVEARASSAAAPETADAVRRQLREAILELARLGECRSHAELLAGAATLHGRPAGDDAGEAGAARAELHRTERLLEHARRRVCLLIETLKRLTA